MLDLSLELLFSRYKEEKSPKALWIADEQTDIQELVGAFSSSQKPFLMSNRYEQVRAWKAAQGEGIASDYQFSSLTKEQLPDQIFFRLAKEKALVHYIVNESLSLLPVGGILWIAGEVKEGVKSLLEKLEAFPSLNITQERGKARLVRVEKTAAITTPLLDDRGYGSWHNLEEGYLSKPGIFGWSKLDEGTKLLWKTLPTDPYPSSILDLGCGYGWLAVEAGKRWPKAELVATDNNVTALLAAEQNFVRFNLKKWGVIPSDAGDEIERKFDLILCNPPFHQGFAWEGDLSHKFLNAAARLLTLDGTAYFVVNSFIPLEKKAAQIFPSIKTLENNGKFKVVSFMKGIH